MSADGSRIVVAKQVSVDAAGNTYWHPYLHLGGSANTIDLAPGSTSGVLYNGMTEDGGAFYFTTPDPLESDGDTSADLYRAEVDGAGVDLTRLSTGSGATGDSDDCDPVSNSSNVNWNSVDAASDCSVAPIAAGGGIAREDGSIYFLSPELLDGSANGTEDAPNLYLARPGQAPSFVTTLESELTGTPALQQHPFVREQGIIAEPKTLAVDRGNGDLYVLDADTSTVQRFDSTGAPLPFSASQAYVDGNKLTGTPAGAFDFAHFSNYSQLAVDSSGGPADGYLYVTNPKGEGGIDVFDSTGTFRGKLPSPSTEDCGVAVDPSGSVYVGNVFGGIRKWTPVDGDPSKDVDKGGPGGFGMCNVAVDSTGAAYGHYFFGKKVEKFAASSFGGPSSSTTVVPEGGAQSIAVDPASDDLYTIGNGRIRQYDSSGKLVSDSDASQAPGAQGIAVDADGEIYVPNANGAGIAVFGALEPGSNPRVDNPAVVHAVNDAETHRYGDFQVTPNGRYAAFVSTLALTGYDTNGHAEVYRYDDDTDAIDCASCAPTGVQASGDAALAANGLSLSSDGKVFFNSTDELAPRDLNKKKDAYEWAENGTSEGVVELISTGTSAHDSSLLGISTDGTDAFFFTRQQLVAGDENGTLVRIYDARAKGGFETLPAEVPCQASDECHGAGTEQAPPPAIGTFKGSLGNVTEDKSKMQEGLRQEERQVQEEAEEGQEAARKAQAEGRRTMKARKIILALVSMIAVLAIAAPAQAAIGIESFEVTSSTTLAGDHPDLRTKLRLADPGAPEAASNVTVNLPRGMFGNPNAVTRCTGADFALQQCPVNSQVGVVTVWAAYQADSNTQLGTAPIYNIEPGPEQTALFGFITPKLHNPVSIPVAVRTGSDYGMRFTVSEISQLTPLAAADLTYWAYPALSAHDAERFPKGSPGLARRMRRQGGRGLPQRADPEQRSATAVDAEPERMHGRAADRDDPCAELSGPRQPLPERVRVPGDDGLRTPDLQPRPARRPDHQRERLADRARPGDGSAAVPRLLSLSVADPQRHRRTPRRA